MGFFSEGLKNEFEIVVVSEPSEVEPLKVYCSINFWYVLDQQRKVHSGLQYKPSHCFARPRYSYTESILPSILLRQTKTQPHWIYLTKYIASPDQDTATLNLSYQVYCFARPRHSYTESIFPSILLRQTKTQLHWIYLTKYIASPDQDTAALNLSYQVYCFARPRHSCTESILPRTLLRQTTTQLH